MKLYVVRHGRAGNPEKWTGDDRLRPLTEAGHREAKRLGKALAALADRPALVLTSPLLRARQTADALAQWLDVVLREDERLAPGCDLVKLAEMLHQHHDAESLIIAGHEPDLSALVGSLIGAAERPAQVDMRKGACACVSLQVPARATTSLAGRGTLEWLLPPDVLEALRQ